MKKKGRRKKKKRKTVNGKYNRGKKEWREKVKGDERRCEWGGGKRRR